MKKIFILVFIIITLNSYAQFNPRYVEMSFGVNTTIKEEKFRFGQSFGLSLKLNQTLLNFDIDNDYYTATVYHMLKIKNRRIRQWRMLIGGGYNNGGKFPIHPSIGAIGDFKNWKPMFSYDPIYDRINIGILFTL